MFLSGSSSTSRKTKNPFRCAGCGRIVPPQTIVCPLCDGQVLVPEANYSGAVSSIHQHPIWHKLVVLWKNYTQLHKKKAEKELYALLQQGRREMGTILNPEGFDLWAGDESDLKKHISRSVFMLGSGKGSKG